MLKSGRVWQEETFEIAKSRGCQGFKSAVYLFLECFFISGVKFFTFCNRNMRTFDLLIVKGDTLRLLIVKCVSYD